jgi:hypothetical protein
MTFNFLKNIWPSLQTRFVSLGYDPFCISAWVLAFEDRLLISQLIKCIIHLIRFIVNSFVLYFYVTQNLQLTSESISQLIKDSITPNVFDVNLYCCFFTTEL